MAQDAKGSKSFGAVNRTIAALQFHAERVREKAGDNSTVSDHNEILGNMVDIHYRNMSEVRDNLLNYQPSNLRSTDLDLELDDFDISCEDDRNGALRTRSQNTSSLLDSSDYPASVTFKPGSSVLSKKAAQDVDPLSLFRQMRAGTMSRGTTSQHIPSSLKGAYAFLPTPEMEPEDDGGLKVDPMLRRGKSFLCRSVQQEGAAYEMLAQIRGPKWNSDSMSVKSSKSLTGKSGEIVLLTTSRSELRGDVLSSSLGPTVSGLPAVCSKSFSAGPSKRPSALPGVSVETMPYLMGSADIEKVPVRPSVSGASSGGLLSKLRSVMKR